MKVNGQVVKRRRKKLNLTQNQLAEGICKQATVSNIERKNSMNSMSILVKLCERLDLPLDLVTQASEEAELHSEFQKIHELIQSGHLSKASKLINQMDRKETLLSDHLDAEFYLYQGYLKLFYEEKESEGLFYLHKLVLTEENSTALYRVLAITVLAKFYTLKQMYPQAESFIEDVLEELEQTAVLKSEQRMTAFYNEGAEYYKQVGEFQKGLDFCEQGLSICVDNLSLINLDKLVEKRAELMKALGDTNAAEELAFSERVKALVRKQQ